MSQPQRKPSFVSQLIPFAVIYLAFMLYFRGTNQAPTEIRTSDQILIAMRDQSSKELDQSIVDNRRALDSRISSEVTAKTLTEADADKKRLEGLLLTADTQLRAGIRRGEINRIDAAYQTLQGEWKSKRDTPLWNEATFAEPTGSLSGQETWQRTTAALNVANQKDLLYGFIPAYGLIDFLVKATGAIPSISYALAALVLAMVVRALIFPLSQHALMWGRQMAQLAPLTKELKEKYKDPSEQGLKTMELYKEYGINPYGGCLPALIQLPLFLTVYKCMLHYRFQFASGTFLWINPATSASTHGFFAPNLGMEDKTLIVIYGVSMGISTLLTPVSDPNNMKQHRMLGVRMSLMFAGMMLFGLFPVPAAFVLYWTFTNILATMQSLRAYRMPLPPLVKVNAPTGGVYATKPRKSGWSDIMREALEKKMEEAQKNAQKPEDKPASKSDDIQPYIPKNGKAALPKPPGAKPTNKPKKRK